MNNFLDCINLNHNVERTNRLFFFFKPKVMEVKWQIEASCLIFSFKYPIYVRILVISFDLSFRFLAHNLI